MPRSNGIFTLIASYFATPGQTIRTEQHNPVLEDIATALTNSVARDGSAPMTGNLQMNGRLITGLGAGVAPSNAVRLDQLPSAASLKALAPPGMIAWFAMSVPPAGWLKANGIAVSRTTQADLFANIGTTFGAGDGSTSFNLPDLRGEFARGLDDGRGVDTGRVLGSPQAEAMLNHTHTGTTSTAGAHNHGATIPQYSGDTDRGGNPSNFSIDTPSALPTDGAHTHTITTGNPSAGGGTETRPRNIALLACIKT